MDIIIYNAKIFFVILKKFVTIASKYEHKGSTIKTLLLFLTLTLSLFADAYESLNYTRDYPQALDRAQKEHKMIVLLVVSNDCKWCKKLASTSLNTPEVRSVISKKFIPVVVNKDDKSNFPTQFQTPRVPTIFYLDPNGLDVWETIGFKDAEGILEDLSEAQESFDEEAEEE